MAKVIIAIHGLRNKPPKSLLLEWGKKSINEGIDYLKTDVKLPEMELAYWADILYDKPLSQDETVEKSPYFIDEIYVPSKKLVSGKSYFFRPKFILFLKKIIYTIFLKKDFSLRFPMVSKKFIHTNFSTLEIYFNENCEQHNDDCITRNRINNRLIELLEKHKNDEIFLIAHSMGCIIAFDVLSLLSPDIRVNTFATMGSPLGAPFVVSRIARLYGSQSQNHIKLQTPESVTNRWCNFADIKDSIAMDYKLSDEFSENRLGVKVEDFLVENSYEINGKPNHHKSFGYLRTPEFINVLIDFVNEKQR